MGMYKSDMARAATTSDPFNAIAEPRRRHILELVADEERSVGEIADALALNQPSVSKHLQVLLDVFARYWRGQLRRIKAHAEGKR